jgi:hypothetical protein
MGSADDRRFEVLRAIVADFVATREPIGSKALVERHGLGVSSATVRNDMAVLEAEGYIAAPHTSSGRIPTEKGYREFVDRIDEVKPLSSVERRAILSFLESGVDLDDVLRRAVRLLAQLTRQVAIVQYPTLSASTVSTRMRTAAATFSTNRRLTSRARTSPASAAANSARAGRGSSLGHSLAIAEPLATISRQPRCPHGHSGPSGSIGIWPISPAVPRDPRHSWPPITRPAARPVPRLR